MFDCTVNPVTSYLYPNHWELGGIYAIVNKVTGRYYVGSTKNFKERIVWSHYPDLSAGRHPNIHLQRSFDKHGENAFEAQILEVCIVDEQFDTEQWYLDNTKASDRDVGYNIRPRADKMAVAEETKQKISAALTGRPSPNKGTKRSLASNEKQRQKMLGRKCSEEHKAKVSAAGKGRRMKSLHKAVGQYSLDGTFIKKYDCTLDVERDGFSRTPVVRCCNGVKQKQHKGFLWKFILRKGP